MMKSIFTHALEQIFPSSSGARPALPMGVAPEAIVGFLFEYRLIIFFFNLAVQPVEVISPFPLDFYIHFIFELIVHRVRIQRSRWE
jgi:hypothetical protein